MVGVAHRQCRQDEWVSNHQWRLSFSRAEAVLLNNWMPIQQIVYHMLRFFMKTEGLTHIADIYTGCRILSEYNIKVLMLWACEMKGRSWWIDDLNVVGICVKRLHILADWFTDSRCPHYFINNCNLFDSLDNSQLTQNTAHILQSVTEAWLAEWFVNNCIRKSSRDLCPDIRVSRLFDDVSTYMKLQNAVSAVVAWRRDNSVLDLWEVFHPAEFHIAAAVYPHLLTTRSFVYWMTELAQIHSRLCVYFLAVAFLQVANKSLSHGDTVNDEVRDILATIRGQFTDTSRRHPNNLSVAMSLLDTAAKLMKVVANTSPSTMSSLLELSMSYLYKAWRCLDS